MYKPSDGFLEGIISCLRSFSSFISDEVNRDLSLDECSIVLSGQNWIDHTFDLNRAVFLLQEYGKLLNDQYSLF